MSRLGADAGTGRDRMAEAAPCPPRETSTYRRMEVTMKFFDSTSIVMVLIMAGVFAPVIVIHILATSVFH